MSYWESTGILKSAEEKVSKNGNKYLWVVMEDANDSKYPTSYGFSYFGDYEPDLLFGTGKNITIKAVGHTTKMKNKQTDKYEMSPNVNALYIINQELGESAEMPPLNDDYEHNYNVLFGNDDDNKTADDNDDKNQGFNPDKAIMWD